MTLNSSEIEMTEGEGQDKTVEELARRENSGKRLRLTDNSH